MSSQSQPALKQAPSEIASARPACAQARDEQRRSAICVTTSVATATFTGVRMFCFA